MPKRTPRPRPLTMPERLALVAARIEVRQSHGWVAQADFGQRTTVLPRTALFVGFEGLGDAQLDGTRPTVEARITVNGSKIPAVAVSGVTRKDVRMAVHDRKLGAAWTVAAHGVDVVTSDRSGLPESEPGGAIVGGHRLAEALAHSGIDTSFTPDWATAARDGWVQGGPLGAECPRCGRPLVWFDWLHADAVRHVNTALMLCDAHGPVRLSGPDELLASRRDLDTGLKCTRAADRRHVYVFDVTGPGLENAVYVGESSREPHERRQQHIDGYKRAAKLNKPGRAIGGLRPDLVPDLPPLFGDVSRYAERWLAEVLHRHGFQVLGGH